jgi:hypothetical protein
MICNSMPLAHVSVVIRVLRTFAPFVGTRTGLYESKLETNSRPLLRAALGYVTTYIVGAVAGSILYIALVMLRRCES